MPSLTINIFLSFSVLHIANNMFIIRSETSSKEDIKMTYFCLALAAFAILVLILPTHNGSTPDDLPESKPSRRNPPHSSTQFIDAHLHKDDAQKARHKQNQ